MVVRIYEVPSEQGLAVSVIRTLTRTLLADTVIITLTRRLTGTGARVATVSVKLLVSVDGASPTDGLKRGLWPQSLATGRVFGVARVSTHRGEAS
jgi:hypothetical protein